MDRVQSGSSFVVRVLVLLAATAMPAQRAFADATVTVGGVGANYATLKAAFDDVNAGVLTGIVDIQVTGDTVETVPAVLNASGSGSANYTAVEIYPTGAKRTISGNVIGPLVDLNGADGVTIDGRLGGGGSGLSLVLDNTNALNIVGSTGQTLKFRNDATGIVVRSVELRGAATATGSQEGVVSFGDPASGGLGNSGIVLRDCDIRESSTGTTPTNAIAAGVGTGAPNWDVTIRDNRIYDFFNAGVDHSGLRINSGGGTGWTIRGNSFYSTVTRNITTATVTWHAINIQNGSGNGFVIEGNFIGGTAQMAGGPPLTLTGAGVFRGIRLSVGASPATSVQGNTIQNLSVTTSSTSTAQSAIGLVTGSFDCGTVTPNQVGAVFGLGSISVSFAGAGRFSGIQAGTGTPGTIRIENNVIGSISVSGIGTPTVRGISCEDASATAAYTIRGNLVGSETAAGSVSSSTNSAMIGIFSSSRGTVTIADNTVANLSVTATGTGNTLVGILAQPTSAQPGLYSITGNTVRNLVSASGATGTGSSAAIVGISDMSNSQGGQLIARNVVHSLENGHASAAAWVIGINFNGPATGANVVERNFVHSLRLATTSTSGTLVGLYSGGGLAGWRNNMVRLGVDASGASLTVGYAITGLFLFNASATSDVLHNTAWVGGTGVATSTSNTAAFASSVTLNTRTFRNNTWVNRRSNAAGTAVHAAAIIAGTLPSPAGLSCSHNVYFADGSGGTDVRNGTTNYTLAAWQTASAVDAASLSGNPKLVAEGAPAATVDLHVDPLAVPAPVGSNGGAAGLVAVDFDGATRSATTPDIGADEYVLVPALGSTPDDNALGAPLMVIKTPSMPEHLDLTWGAGCGNQVTGYALFEGTLGSWYGHGLFNGICGLNAFSATHQAQGGADTYYLVVPVNGSLEGSYGQDSAGNEIPPGMTVCRPTQSLDPCP